MMAIGRIPKMILHELLCFVIIIACLQIRTCLGNVFFHGLYSFASCSLSLLLLLLRFDSIVFELLGYDKHCVPQ